MPDISRRVVITGAGIVSPIGNHPARLWDNLIAGNSGVRFLQSLPASRLPGNIGGEAAEFDGSIDSFGELDKTLKRSIKKSLRLMCREIEMGVATAQFALQDAGNLREFVAPERIGTLFGSDYIMTHPAEYADGIRKCMDSAGCFQMDQWGDRGMSEVEPLWLLKYLPNMPASHVAIQNDLRGPSNSITMREASANVSVAEAVTTIRRGIADAMLAGSTGTRIHPLRSVHAALQENLATDFDDPANACRPFDRHRSGMVLGEGAGCLILEELETARQRQAHILGEVIGYSSSSVSRLNGGALYRQALENVLAGVLENAKASPGQIGHIHAHGLATITCDRDEAAAIHTLFGDREVPVVAAKSYMGNLGAGSGIVEIVASLQTLKHNRLFPILNYKNPDPQCEIVAAQPDLHPPGDSFINVNVTSRGQASAVLVKKFEENS